MPGKLFGTWPVAGSDARGGGAADSVGTATSDTSKVNAVVMPQKKPGSVHPDVNGGLWVYGTNTATAMVEGDWVKLNLSDGVMVDLIQGDTTEGRSAVGVIGGTIALDDYGWAQVFGHNTHAGFIGDTQTTTAVAGRWIFCSATAGRATSDTAVNNVVRGAFTTVASNTADTAMGVGFYVGADLMFPWVSSTPADSTLFG